MDMDYFEVKHRAGDDGQSYTTLRDDAPDWVLDVVREAHDGELPNDWRYETCRDIFQLVADGVTETSEIADSLTEHSTYMLLTWLADNVHRVAHVDDATDEYGPTDGLAAMIQRGQYHAIEQMAQLIVDAIGANGGDES